jgi:hypothetical protein
MGDKLYLYTTYNQLNTEACCRQVSENTHLWSHQLLQS